MQIDVSTPLAYIMSIKEDTELLTIKRASQISVDLYNKYLKDQIMEIIDSEKVCSNMYFYNLMCCYYYLLINFINFSLLKIDHYLIVLMFVFLWLCLFSFSCHLLWVYTTNVLSLCGSCKYLYDTLIYTYSFLI